MLFLMVMFPVASHAVEDRERKEYWINKYGLIKDGDLASRAHKVFERVLSAADRSPGIEPELFIINYSNTPWAQSLADGSIIITKMALDFCYQNLPHEQGDSRFAFVVGHELAHQFKGDFWHYKFLRSADKNNINAFQDIKELAKSQDVLMAKELQADQYGIIYSVLAGYGSEEIISSDKNFFFEWTKKEISSMSSDRGINLFSEKRTKAVTMNLKEASERIVLFQMGVISYHIGRYDDALALFERFASYFPGREVYANIGTIYLKKAYDAFLSSRTHESFPFVLSFGVDTVTRAESIDISRGFSEDRYKEYKVHLKKAAKNLSRAIRYDNLYNKAKNSLGCSYILEGKYYDAVSILEEALNSAPNDKQLQSNLSVAYILLGERVGSRDLIAKAKSILASSKEYDDKARSNWNALLYMEGTSIITDVTSNFFDETFHAFCPIEFRPNADISAGELLSNKQRVKVIEAISSESVGDLKVLEHNNKIYSLVKDETIVLVLYRNPSGLKTNVHDNGKSNICITGEGRSGLMLSKDRMLNYFEY